jgi:hypothetical protein
MKLLLAMMFILISTSVLLGLTAMVYLVHGIVCELQDRGEL